MEFWQRELIILFLIVFPFEIFPRWKAKEKIFDSQFRSDLGYYFIGLTLVPLIIVGLCYPLSLGLLRLGADNSLFQQLEFLPPWLRWIPILFLIDLGAYWYHRGIHHFDSVWKFHRVHHSSRRLTWFAGIREHYFLIIAVNTLFFLISFSLGVGFTEQLVLITIFRFVSLLQHTALPFRLKWLEPFVMTPYFHQFHHDKVKGRYVNFATVFPVLDKIFGTYYCPKQSINSDFGIQEKIGEGLIQEQLSPWRNP
jgi:sterol desaturase/sphingolipid hydroxylase (fatty acid hydroxylase superfamily)